MFVIKWVKRQRYQYKLKCEGSRSTLSDERVRLLNQIGFIWNSHDAVWEERWNELLEFKRLYGHCIVPSNYENNTQLAVWVKRQRRQYKFYSEGQATSMTQERIDKLEKLGFAWDCRKTKSEDGSNGGTAVANNNAGSTKMKTTPAPSTASNTSLSSTNGNSATQHPHLSNGTLSPLVRPSLSLEQQQQQVHELLALQRQLQQQQERSSRATSNLQHALLMAAVAKKQVQHHGNPAAISMANFALTPTTTMIGPNSAGGAGGGSGMIGNGSSIAVAAAAAAAAAASIKNNTDNDGNLVYPPCEFFSFSRQF